MDAAEAYARENGYCEIDLLVTANNTDAVTFYEKASYAEERILMKKTLMGNCSDCIMEENEYVDSVRLESK